MIGIYMIADRAGRVYYIGQSKDIEKRAKQHIYEMQRDESDYRKNKMYWILGRMYHSELDLGLYIVKECKENELQRLEDTMIRVFKPVLNSKIPKGGEKFIQWIDTVTDAIFYAGFIGRKKIRRINKIVEECG